MGTTQVNPAVIGNLQTPQIQPQNPLQAVSAISALKSQQIDNQLRSAQTADYQAQAQQRQLDLQDQSTLQKLMADPEANKRIQTGDFSDLAGKVQPTTLAKLQTTQADYQAKLNSNTEAQIKQRKDALGEINESLMGMKALPDLASMNAALPGVVAGLNNSGVLKRAGMDPSKLPQQLSDPSQIDMALANTGGLQAAHEKALADKKTQAEADKATQDAAKAKADAGATQQKIDLQNQWIKQFKEDPQSGDKLIDKIMGDDPAASGFKAALASTPSLEAGQEIIKAATSHAAERTAKLDPKVRQAQINDAAAKAYAEIGGHVQEAVQKQIAEAKASPDMFASISDPVARRQAEAGYTKLSLDSQQQVSDAKRLQEYVQAAQSGNKAAAGLIPIVELRQIVNRVNSAELKAAGTPGNLIDKGVAALNGLVNGVPISAEGLKAISELSQAQEQNTLRNYQAKIGVMSQVYGNPKLKPLDLEGNYSTARGSAAASAPIVQHSPSTGAYRYSTDGGKTWQAGQPQQ